jgi:hypothetical protein
MWLSLRPRLDPGEAISSGFTSVAKARLGYSDGDAAEAAPP